MGPERNLRPGLGAMLAGCTPARGGLIIRDPAPHAQLVQAPVPHAELIRLPQ
jgi:hypothetical protein